MEHRLEARDFARISSSLDQADRGDILTHLLSLIGIEEPTTPLEVRQDIQIRTYQLGDEVLVYPNDSLPGEGPNTHTSLSVFSSLVTTDIYFVEQGRVRLLCPIPGTSRWVTAQLLDADDMFGYDHRFITQALGYRVVAASNARLMVIPKASLETLLTLYPVLERELSDRTEQRCRTIFFKSFTPLRQIPSYDLGQLVTHVIEEHIPQDVLIDDIVPLSDGHYWLREGEILLEPTDATEQSTVSQGFSWGYPGIDIKQPWRSKTAITIYKLPTERWALCIALVPGLQTCLRENQNGNGSVNGNGSSHSHAPYQMIADSRRRKTLAARRPPPILPSSSPSAQSPTPPESGENMATDEIKQIVFPKPASRKMLDALRKYPWVEQQSSSDCGAACLSMISRYWGKRFPLNYLREQANVNQSGASLKSLAKAAEVLGFHTRSVRASIGRIADQTNPWIAHWDGNHYIVVYSIHGDQVTIADPALGRQTIARQEFAAHWTGYALLLDPTEYLHQTEVKQGSLGRYIQALLPYRKLVFQIVVVSVLIQLFGLVSPLFTQIILDKVVVQKSIETLNVFAIGLVLFNVWGLAMSSVRQYLLSYFSNRIDLTLISGFIRHTITLPLKFFESRRVGDVLTRVQENQKIQRFLIGQVVLAWLNFVTGFVYLGLMLYYNWQLTILVLGLIPPIVIVTLGATPFLRRLSRAMFKEVAEQNSSLVELITGISTVKTSGVEQEFRWGWEEKLTSQLNMRFKTQKFGIGLQALNGFINAVGGAILLWFGARLVIQDQLSIGQFVAFNMMMGHVISPVLALANLWDELQEVLISVERLNDVFETEPEEIPGHPLLTMPPISGSVMFDDLTFRYDGSDENERNTLQNISLTVDAGQTVAIVGRSGSGKTTLVKLLQGLYEPTHGKITIDGLDLQHVSPQSLRSQIGVVPQECFLFSGTILENITLGRAEFGLSEAIEAAKLAEAHPFIQSLPMGYRTKVGERGSTLSGGQRQRIAIARALLGQPNILILDEATSSLDTESERRFQRNLDQVSRNRTTFIIAHRLSTVRNADQIIVLDRGILVEQGNHEELMAYQGLYYHLAQQQLNL